MKKNCTICGLPVDLENLHPDSLEVPTESTFYVAHHSCQDDGFENIGSDEDENTGGSTVGSPDFDDRAWITIQ